MLAAAANPLPTPDASALNPLPGSLRQLRRYHGSSAPLQHPRQPCPRAAGAQQRRPPGRRHPRPPSELLSRPHRSSQSPLSDYCAAATGAQLAPAPATAAPAGRRCPATPPARPTMHVASIRARTPRAARVRKVKGDRGGDGKGGGGREDGGGRAGAGANELELGREKNERGGMSNLRLTSGPHCHARKTGFQN
ncbi:hypothetical protein BS78_09G124100 [Paspalum vaginatum]|nr:hypothetical protein BS78_09G124100 [Paspalum vaginatum]